MKSKFLHSLEIIEHSKKAIYDMAEGQKIKAKCPKEGCKGQCDHKEEHNIDKHCYRNNGCPSCLPL